MAPTRLRIDDRRGENVRILKRVLLGLVVLVIAGMAVGAIYQSVATSRDAKRFTMPGEHIDIGGRALHLSCKGDGPTTVLLENGLTANYTTWLQVQSGLAARAKVCSYDRAGLGWSDPSPNPTRAEFVAADLYALRAAAGVQGPTMLVGWSAGGVFIRRYFREHPDGIVGMVFVDSSHEQQRNRLPSGEEMQSFERNNLALLAWCRRLAWGGIVRVSGAMDAAAIAQHVPEAVRPESVAMSNRTGYCTGVSTEIAGFQADVS